MMAGWATYCLLVALLLGASAWLAERASRAQGWPARWPWAGALAGSIGLPLWAWLGPGSSGPSGAAPAVPLPGSYVMEALPPLMLSPAGSAGPSLGAVMLWGWVLSSAGLLLYLVAAGLRVRVEGRGWRRDEVDGVDVLVSERTGPAALGLLRGRVVLPEWALALDARLRRLLVLHESEHVRAGDPQLAVAGLLVCALMPWNPALWWQLSRLRLAIEVDCDARVLRRSNDAAGYGSLLLEVGQRRSRLALGLAESRSMLERRIRMIARTERGRKTVRAAGLGGLAALVLAVACETPGPTGLADSASRPAAPDAALASASELPCEPLVYVDGVATSRATLAALVPEMIETIEVVRGRWSIVTSALELEGVDAAEPDARCGTILVLRKDASPEAVERTRRVKEVLAARREGAGARQAVTLESIQDAPTFTPMTDPPRLTNVPVVQRELMRRYPPLLREAGIGGTATVWFLIDTEGVVRRTSIHQSAGYDALDQAAIAVAEIMEFSPAYNRDVRVPVWVALPITFESSGGDTGGDTDGATERTRRERERETEREVDRLREFQTDADPRFTPMTVQPRLSNASEVRDALTRHYPPLLRDAGIEGTTSVWLFIDETGAVTRVRMDRGSGHDALDQAALRVASLMRFEPARNGDEPVAVWVALPVVFQAP